MSTTKTKHPLQSPGISEQIDTTYIQKIHLPSQN